MITTEISKAIAGSSQTQFVNEITIAAITTPAETIASAAMCRMIMAVM
jgi:hypothetical protein